MILTKEQIEKRITSKDNIVNKIKEAPEIVIKDHAKNHTGNHGTKNLSDEQRVAIGVLARVTDNQTAANIFGISPGTANNLKYANRNHTSNNENYVDIPLLEKINDRLASTKMSIQERAAEKLLMGLGLLTEDKMENCSAKDVAQITNQMSQVVRNISGISRENNPSDAKVKIILHQPKPTEERHFDYVEIGVK